MTKKTPKLKHNLPESNNTPVFHSADLEVWDRQEVLLGQRVLDAKELLVEPKEPRADLLGKLRLVNGLWSSPDTEFDIVRLRFGLTVGEFAHHVRDDICRDRNGGLELTPHPARLALTETISSVRPNLTFFYSTLKIKVELQN